MNKLSTMLIVKNLDASTHFFVNVLDFTLEEKYDDCVKLNYGGGTVIIFHGTKDSVEYNHGFDSNSTLVITVSNLDHKITKLKSKGIEFIHQIPGENKWGRYAAFKDPSGIIHELFELKSFG